MPKGERFLGVPDRYVILNTVLRLPVVNPLSFAYICEKQRDVNEEKKLVDTT